MPEFLTLLPPQDALAVLLANLPPANPCVEIIPVENTLGRINASDVLAPESLPAFDRSTVDGFAVHASDTFGASESLPTYLLLAEEISMGKPAELPLKPRHAAPIHTGGMLPPGADAVVMLEYSQFTGGSEVEILRPVAPLENILKAGEDIQSGQILLPRGKLIRPPEIGGLSALGIQSISCFPKPNVGILSSGDEVIPPGQIPLPGQVRDINSFTLSALAEKHGASVTRYGILPDEEEIIHQRLKEVLQQSDLVIITAGSSASTRDLTARVVHQMGGPGVLVHGVNLKPGKPTILAVCDGKPIIGLPGNPVSALVVAGLFVVPVIHHLSGLTTPPQQSRVPAHLTINLASQAGREDWVPVKLIPSAEGWLAEPIFYKSNLIFSLVAADGLIRIPPISNGLPAMELVEVYIL
jgi:molybdopterin molybdotransferase